MNQGCWLLEWTASRSRPTMNSALGAVMITAPMSQADRLAPGARSPALKATTHERIARPQLCAQEISFRAAHLHERHASEPSGVTYFRSSTRKSIRPTHESGQNITNLEATFARHPPPGHPIVAFP